MKIILPTDFSDNARGAIEYAISMFSYENVEYILLNTYTDPYSSTDVLISIQDLLSKRSIEGLKNEYDYLRKKFPTDLFAIKQCSEYGELANVINNICEEETIDYVVMGTKGSTGLEKVFIGSTTADVIKKVKCPVLAIPTNTIYTPPIKIAFATDYQELEYNDVFSPLTELAQQYQSELLIVNVQPEGELINNEDAISGIKLHRVLEKIPHQFYGINDNNVTEGINDFIHKYNVDMIAMIAKQHSFFEQIFHNSISEKLLTFTDIPLLILHEK